MVPSRTPSRPCTKYTDNAAAVTARHALGHIHALSRHAFAATGTVGAKQRAVQLKHGFASGSLVKPVDVLSYHGFELAISLKLSQTAVGRVGPSSRYI